MRLMHSCRHSSSLRPIIIIIIIATIIISIIVPASLPLPPTHSPLLHFFPWSEFRSATALTHTHDETE